MRGSHPVIVCLLAVAVTAAAAQESKPTAEHKRLEYFVGDWISEGDMKESAVSPGGKMTSEDKCEWFEGGYAVVCRSEGTSPLGPMTHMGIIGYNPMEKVYTYYGVENNGMAMTTVPRGTVKDKVWTFDDETTVDGKPMVSRFVMTEKSKEMYTWSWSMKDDKGNWVALAEGKMTRK